MKATIFTVVALMLLTGFNACKTNKQAQQSVKPDMEIISPNLESTEKTLNRTGEIPEKTDMSIHTLNKTLTDSIDETICNKYWKLVELNGKPVTYKEGIPSEAHISFKADGKVYGSFSCNNFNGSYRVIKGAANRIRFSGLVSTMKMCLDMTIEDELSRVLNIADSYYVNDGKELILNRARMAPLAKFEVVYMN